MSAGRPRSVPTYRHHKQSGQAIVTLTDDCGNRRDVLLGKHGSRASREEYGRVIGEWEAAGRCPPQPAGTAAVLTVNELLLRFFEHARQHYRHADGRPTGELDEYKYTLRQLRENYGPTPAANFGPLMLKSARRQMIAGGLCRNVVNQRVGRIKRMFKWAASEELLPYATFAALATVSGLQRGRSTARESEPVGPVGMADVEAVLPYVGRHVRGLIRFQMLTGCRPGEACALRACDITTGEGVWLYRPAVHKLSYRGANRIIVIGPMGQELVNQFLTSRLTDYLFSPARAVTERSAERRAKRRTPVQPSQVNRPRKCRPRRTAGEKYSAESYGRAVARACRRAGIASWHPNMLRHAYATNVRARFGLEGAQVVLGHAKATTTEIYAERDLSLAARVAAAVG
jgi:integrase